MSTKPHPARPIEELSNEDLLYQYKYVVCRNHYDPIWSPTPDYNEDQLKAEIHRRFAAAAPTAEE